MKKKMFYAHLVETSSISLELGDMELSQEERINLTTLIDSNIHNSVLDTVLSNLSEEDKKIFLVNLHGNDHGKTWTHLKSKIENAENKIKKVIDLVKKELHEDIKEAKAISC